MLSFAVRVFPLCDGVKYLVDCHHRGNCPCPGFKVSYERCMAEGLVPPACANCEQDDATPGHDVCAWCLSNLTEEDELQHQRDHMGRL